MNMEGNPMNPKGNSLFAEVLVDINLFSFSLFVGIFSFLGCAEY